MSGQDAGGRLLGIDFGTKRIGFALSDERGWTAEPHSVWHRTTLEADLAHVCDLIVEHEVREVVVGLPYRMDGSEGSSIARAKVFVEALRASMPPIPLHTRDETLTTFEAEAQMRELGLTKAEAKEKVDAYAALVILREFLRERGAWIESEREPPAPSRGRKGRRR